MTLREAVVYCPKGRIWDSLRAALLIGPGRGHARMAMNKSKLAAFKPKAAVPAFTRIADSLSTSRWGIEARDKVLSSVRRDVGDLAQPVL